MLPSTRQYITNSTYGRFGGYLENQHFFGTLFLALLLHLGGIALYQILPREVVELVPVRVLNIKIGQPVAHNPLPQESPKVKEAKAEEARSTRDLHVPITPAQAAPKKPGQPKQKPQQKPKAKAPKQTKPAPTAKPAVVKNNIVKPASKPLPAKQPQKQANTITKQTKPELPKITGGISIAEAALTMKAQEALTPKQYVREDTIAYQQTSRDENGKAGQGAAGGSAIGNSTMEDAEIESRYTQTLSLWLNRYKVYPSEARSAGIGGTVMLRIRINRQGRIMRYYLEQSSGHDVIDRAISTMVNAANPVPAVPPNYPDPPPYLEFLVPIHFKP